MNIDDLNQVNPEGVEYSNIKNLINVFSSTEYDSLEKAASEIIDNSIDAKANNICIFLRSKYDAKKGKIRMSEIAFLDDGQGMTPGLMQHIVGFGSTSRVDGGTIGKFGIGLNQASLFACARFDVYSWKREDEVYLETFDSDYIIQNNITKALPPQKVSLPSYILDSSIYKQYCKNHGTLIIWSQLKDAKTPQAKTVAKHMHNEFGRVYRYYINDNKVQIYTQTDSSPIDLIQAIDPLCLLPNTYFLGDPDGHSTKAKDAGEPLFEPFNETPLVNGVISIKIPYYDNNNTLKESKVYLKAAIIKEKFYYSAAIKDNFKQPGDTEIGKYLKELQKGITVVRNNREIDFGYFGFYDSINQPQDRWFKLEILFNEELDDVFHVSNNKQHVEIKKINESSVDVDENDPSYPIWLRLKPHIDYLLSKMRSRNKKLANRPKQTKEITDTSLGPTIDSYLDNGNVETSENLSFDYGGSNDTGKIIISESKKEDVETQILNAMKSQVTFINKQKDWVVWTYDYDLDEYFFNFDLDKINKNRFNFGVEVLIINTCIMLSNELEHSAPWDVLNNLLNKYKDYICGGK